LRDWGRHSSVVKDGRGPMTNLAGGVATSSYPWPHLVALVMGARELLLAGMLRRSMANIEFAATDTQATMLKRGAVAGFWSPKSCTTSSQVQYVQYFGTWV
jgi:hypothetical protein